MILTSTLLKQFSDLQAQLVKIDEQIRKVHAAAMLLTRENANCTISLSVAQVRPVYERPAVPHYKQRIQAQMDMAQAQINTLYGDDWKNEKEETPLKEVVVIDVEDTDMYSLFDTTLSLLTARRAAIKAKLMALGLEVE